MGRKKKYQPKEFESTGVANDTSANIYESMLKSEAFKDLSKNQRLLYVYLKSQYYGKRKPGKDNPEIEALQSTDMFYFNFAVAEKYNLYSRGNKGKLYSDIRALETHGFIKTVSNGRATQSRSIYQYSSDWKNWEKNSDSG